LNLYAESSAVLAWLLGEARGTDVRDRLESAELVIASDLTLVECDRVLIRAAALGEMTEADAASRRAELSAVAAQWTMLRVGAEVVDRARRPFPKDPVRTLDALHLASALTAKAAVAGLSVLSLDDDVRANAHALGFELPLDDQANGSGTSRV
jgi:predicted nucleic acid-binding protein